MTRGRTVVAGRVVVTGLVVVAPATVVVVVASDGTAAGFSMSVENQSSAAPREVKVIVLVEPLLPDGGEVLAVQGVGGVNGRLDPEHATLGPLVHGDLIAGEADVVALASVVRDGAAARWPKMTRTASTKAPTCP